MSRAKITEAVFSVLKASDSPLFIKEIYSGVKKKVPSQCDDEVFPCPYCNLKHPKWKHEVRWALQSLKLAKLVESTSRGYWQARKVPQMTPPTPVRSEPTPSSRPHELSKYMIKEIAEVLGKIVHTEYSAPPYQFDIIWKEIDALPPSHVFEVQDKGSLDAALAKLQHARDLWRANLFIVIMGENDKAKLEKLLNPFWQGAFHKLRGHVTTLTPEVVEEIHKVLTSHEDIVKAFMET